VSIGHPLCWLWIVRLSPVFTDLGRPTRLASNDGRATFQEVRFVRPVIVDRLAELLGLNRPLTVWLLKALDPRFSTFYRVLHNRTYFIAINVYHFSGHLTPPSFECKKLHLLITYYFFLLTNE
jgi:hypothetical protein